MHWREVFKRYASIVVRAEGVLFLYEEDWTADEWREIERALDEVEKVTELGRHVYPPEAEGSSS